ncbi:four-carbon acid sugar kinase family protein [Azospirillum halopraeferens]|uniref:four-carbon acid sugar kinase family protein n=1 Tax=Azospirillum halopraeferens TaxID=34010 RepID=UPI0003F82CED|nr:four-carbon acid sugar kinase family protein [Azospirillum halopraeferens]
MSGGGPEIVFVGDDFTGASDTLATLARAGLRTRLFLDPPDPADVASLGPDAVGVATELRALDATTITHRAGAIAGAVAALAPRFIHYKVCSTFDSAPDTGSIGAAVGALAAGTGPALVAVIGGQPGLGRYCLFGHLFAAAADGTVHRIDRHPVMCRHPTTPMAESDLRLHLAAQGLDGLAAIPWTDIGDDAAALADRLAAPAAEDRGVLLDVAATAQLPVIGAALRRLDTGGRPILLVGASSVAEALTGSAPLRRPVPEEGPAATRAAAGPCLIVAGSRSAVTAAQVAAAGRFARVAVPPDAIANAVGAGRIVAAVADHLRAGRHALAHLEPDRAYSVNALTLARRLADLTADIFDAAPVGALGVAGGDTSSVIVRRLGFTALSYRAGLGRGVAVCAGHRPGRPDLPVMLKGGQMGDPDLFDRFAERRTGP